jgi:DMSO reductase family type II enzyme chaperone
VQFLLPSGEKVRMGYIGNRMTQIGRITRSLSPVVPEHGSHEGRGHLYALLGLAYFREPTRGFIEGLAASDPFSASASLPVDEQIAGGLRLLSGSLEPFKRRVSDRDLEQLQGDHFQLLIGSGMPAAPPWESFYRTEERLMVSNRTLEVRSFYERFGLVSERKDQEPEDHIGLELEFMGWLCDRYGQCLRKGDVLGAAPALQAQRDFLDEHLLQWIGRFCQEVARSAWTDFFRGVANLTEGFVAWDRRFLDVSETCRVDNEHEMGL